MKRYKYVETFMELCAGCLTMEGIKSLVQPSNMEQQVSFHKIHERFLSIAEKHGLTKQRIAIEDRYPFVKAYGRWYVSNVKLYMYLMAARPIMLKTGNADMEYLYEAVQSSADYVQKAAELDKRLTPNGVIDYEHYQKELSKLYEEHLAVQLPLLEKIKSAGAYPRSVIRG